MILINTGRVHRLKVDACRHLSRMRFGDDDGGGGGGSGSGGGGGDCGLIYTTAVENHGRDTSPGGDDDKRELAHRSCRRVKS